MSRSRSSHHLRSCHPEFLASSYWVCFHVSDGLFSHFALAFYLDWLVTYTPFPSLNSLINPTLHAYTQTFLNSTPTCIYPVVTTNKKENKTPLLFFITSIKGPHRTDKSLHSSPTRSIVPLPLPLPLYPLPAHPHMSRLPPATSPAHPPSSRTSAHTPSPVRASRTPLQTAP